MKKIGFTWFCMSLIICCSCQKELIEYEQGDNKVRIEKGDEWLHGFLSEQEQVYLSTKNCLFQFSPMQNSLLHALIHSPLI